MRRTWQGRGAGIVVAAVFTLVAASTAGAEPIDGATYKDRPRGEVKTIQIDVSLDGRQIDYLSVQLEKPCAPGYFVPTLSYVKIQRDGSFKRKLKSGGAHGDPDILKARGKFSDDGRTVRGRWSFTDGSINCHADARFAARTRAKPPEVGDGEDAPLGRWSGTTEESLPVEFELYRDTAQLAPQMRDLTFQVNVVCEELGPVNENVYTAEVYEGRVEWGDVNKDGNFEARDGSDSLQVSGKLDRNGAAGRIMVNSITRPDPTRSCSTPNPEGVAFTARPG
jgi:hypothetical protein